MFKTTILFWVCTWYNPTMIFSIKSQIAKKNDTFTLFLHKDTSRRQHHSSQSTVQNNVSIAVMLLLRRIKYCLYKNNVRVALLNCKIRKKSIFRLQVITLLQITSEQVLTNWALPERDCVLMCWKLRGCVEKQRMGSCVSCGGLSFLTSF